MEDPYFWIKRCSQLGQPKSLTNSWTDLVQRHKKSWLIKYIKVKAKNCRDRKTLWHLGKRFLEQKFVQCLIKWTLNFSHLELGGFDPLHAAAQYGCLEVVEFITSYTENVNASWMLNGCTPLHLAAFNGHAKIVEFLLSKVDNPNPIDNIGLSPYDVAVREEKFEVVEILHPYNNYWPTTPLQLPFLGSVEFPSIMQLPILLILKCIWRNWKKSSSAKQFWDSIGTDTIRSGFIFSCFLIFCEAIYLVRHIKEMVYLILICFQVLYMWLQPLCPIKAKFPSLSNLFILLCIRLLLNCILCGTLFDLFILLSLIFIVISFKTVLNGLAIVIHNSWAQSGTILEFLLFWMLVILVSIINISLHIS